MSETQSVEVTRKEVETVCALAITITVDDAVVLANEFKRMDMGVPILDPTAHVSTLLDIKRHEDAARAFLAFRLALEKLSK